MSVWNHPICAACWHERYPGREPVVAAGLAERSIACCFCGEPTVAGIFERMDPVESPCAGVHFEHGAEVGCKHVYFAVPRTAYRRCAFCGHERYFGNRPA